MPPKKKLKKKELKKKKKSTYLIFASEHFKGKQIGETKADDSTKLINRVVNIPLSEISHDPKTKNIKLKFKIKNIQENKASTELVEYQIIPAYIKRVVRAGKSKIDDSFTCKSKDNINIQLKPLIITKFKTQKSVQTQLRMKAREFLTKLLAKEDYKKFSTDIVQRTTQRELSKQLRKLYPVGIVDLRVMKKLD